MRIIAGKYGGRRLVSFKASHIRPTTDRIKEVIFNKLQGDLEGAKVLDLYGGTGNLSFESLSRGCESVCVVEKNPKSIDLIEKNRDLLKITKQELVIVRQDVLRFCEKPSSSVSSSAYDVILIDPPFTESLAHESLEALSQSQLFHSETMVVIESSAKERLEKAYGPLLVAHQKDYGDKKLSFFRVASTVKDS